MDPQLAQLIRQYLAGPAALRQSLAGLTAAETDAFPIPATWSIRQVVCHLTDAEILYADRIKRILAEHEPPLIKADPDSFQATLAVNSRELNDELGLIEAIRTHVAQILTALTDEQFERRGMHSSDGPLTLRNVLERVTAHIPHHVALIESKRARLLAMRQ